MVNVTPSAIAEHVASLRQKGFDQVRFPGGTSKDKLHYSRGVIFRISEDKKRVEFLVLPYDSLSYKRGESDHTKKEGENPIQTLIREVYEETGLMCKQSSIHLLQSKHNQRYNHTKYEYLVEATEGSLQTFSEGNPIDNETGTPFWISYRDAVTYLWDGHKGTLELAKQALMMKKQYALLLL